MSNSFPLIIKAVTGLLASVAIVTHAVAAEPLCLRGVNLSGAEYGERDGTYEKDYIYPSEETVRYFASHRMNAIRLPFQWERLQPTTNERLDGAELDRLRDAVHMIRKAGLIAILDPHNYAYYDEIRIGKPGLPATAFADFWARLAAEFADDPSVLFGLMNEPHDIPAPDWLEAVNLSIAAIRTVGARNLVLVPGTIWTGAHSWEKDIEGGSNAKVMLGVEDPLDHYVFEFHQYMDGDFSGTHASCERADDATKAIADVSAWLRTHGKRGFLGEFGGSKQKACLAGLRSMTSRMAEDSDVWIGWTYWAAGEWWPPEEDLNIQPHSKAVPPQLRALAKSLEGPAEPDRCIVK